MTNRTQTMSTQTQLTPPDTTRCTDPDITYIDDLTPADIRKILTTHRYHPPLRDPYACGSYLTISDTSLPLISLSTLEPGMVLIDPRGTDALYEYREHYTDDLGRTKVKFREHRQGGHRHHTPAVFFKSHVIRDFTYLEYTSQSPTPATTRTSTDPPADSQSPLPTVPDTDSDPEATDVSPDKLPDATTEHRIFACGVTPEQPDYGGAQSVSRDTSHQQELPVDTDDDRPTAFAHYR